MGIEWTQPDRGFQANWDALAGQDLSADQLLRSSQRWSKVHSYLGRPIKQLSPKELKALETSLGKMLQVVLELNPKTSADSFKQLDALHMKLLVAKQTLAKADSSFSAPAARKAKSKKMQLFQRKGNGERMSNVQSRFQALAARVDAAIKKVETNAEQSSLRPQQSSTTHLEREQRQKILSEIAASGSEPKSLSAFLRAYAPPSADPVRQLAAHQLVEERLYRAIIQTESRLASLPQLEDIERFIDDHHTDSLAPREGKARSLNWATKTATEVTRLQRRLRRQTDLAELLEEKIDHLSLLLTRSQNPEADDPRPQ